MDERLVAFAALADAWFFETDADGTLRFFAGAIPDGIGAPAIGARLDDLLRAAGADAATLAALAGAGAAAVEFAPPDAGACSLRLSARTGTGGRRGMLARPGESDAAAGLVAIGKMVAGVAHEINTPVGNALTAATTLVDRTERFLETLESGKILRSALVGYSALALEASRLVLANLERTADLVRGFKQVAVDQASAARRQFDLAQYLDEILLAIGPAIRQSGQAVRVACPPGIRIDGWPGALSQVVVNLVLNCFAHAFDAGVSGTVAIACGVSNGRVRIEVRDDGKGIPDAVRARIFDPFFTTRRNDGGSGLGLHIVHGIVTGPLAGTIAVDSEVGRGTAFAVEFPLVAPGAPQPR